MKKISALALAALLVLQGCATTGSDIESTNSSGLMEFIGVITGVVLGSTVAYKTGDTMQAQNVVNTTWSAFGINPDGTFSNDSDASESTHSSSGNLAQASSMGGGLGSGSGADSSYLRAVGHKRYNFSTENCPNDASGVRKDISYPDLLNNSIVFSKPILSMVKEGGGYDTAIALSEAQRVEYLRAAKEAATQALDSYGGSGDPYATSNCPVIEGIYCSGVHGMWMYGDSAVLTEYIIDAMKCHQQAGTSI